VGFETINAFGHPTMLEGLVKLRRSRLQLHASPQAVGRTGAAADYAVDTFFDVD